jgi:hypothetical protein
MHLNQVILGALGCLIKHPLNIQNPRLNITLLRGPLKQVHALDLIHIDHRPLDVYEGQVMQTLDVLGFRCTLEVLQALFGVVVALAVEVERGQVVQRTREVLLGRLHVILERFFLVAAQDLLLAVLVVKPVLV